jgi:hypothetical protein
MAGSSASWISMTSAVSCGIMPLVMAKSNSSGVIKKRRLTTVVPSGLLQVPENIRILSGRIMGLIIGHWLIALHYCRTACRGIDVFGWSRRIYCLKCYVNDSRFWTLDYGPPPSAAACAQKEGVGYGWCVLHIQPRMVKGWGCIVLLWAVGCGLWAVGCGLWAA